MRTGEITVAVSVKAEDVFDSLNPNTAIAFVKALDKRMADWGFTLAMAEYFAAEKEAGRAEWEADEKRK